MKFNTKAASPLLGPLGTPLWWYRVRKTDKLCLALKIDKINKIVVKLLFHLMVKIVSNVTYSNRATSLCDT